MTRRSSATPTPISLRGRNSYTPKAATYLPLPNSKWGRATMQIGEISSFDRRPFVTGRRTSLTIIAGLSTCDSGTPKMNRALCFSAFLSALSCCNSATAHDTESGWSYPPACCRGDNESGDCQEVPNTNVSTAPDGFTVLLSPGDHHLVKKPHVFRIPYGATIPSGDSHFHICLHPTEDDVNCFFAPAYGF